jgi:BirA family transcriptional regulator, biotin operon repressor / biotin---[acetyl-CoA-carboxylase] ligase
MTGPPWQFYRHETLDSTSDEARRLVVAGGTPARFVVWADRQTKGRGRGSNSWWSDPGSLTATLGIDPANEGLEPRQEPKIALAAALACARVVEPLLGREVEIRWPNDVELAGKKLAGFLVERLEGPDGPRILIGAGVNVATRFDDAPAEVRAMANSLAEAGVPRIEARTRRRWCAYILHSLIRRLADQIQDLRLDEDTFNRALNHRDALSGRPVRIRQGDRIVEGTGRGVNPDGSLRVEAAGGIFPIYGGQVLRDIP